MCIACEMGFWGMMDALPEDVRERILREQAERFACDAPQEPAPPGEPRKDERAP